MIAAFRTIRRAAVVLVLAAPGSASPDVLLPGSTAGAPNQTVDAWLACRNVQPQSEECTTLRAAAIDVLRADFKTLGASGNFSPLAILLKALTVPEPELRAAAADGVGMIGPRATETAALAAAFNDPVPAVRQSARLALGASEDPTAVALGGRALRSGIWTSLEPDRQPDLSKLKFPLYAGATPLRFAVDIQGGTAQLASSDAIEKVLAFYAAKSKRKPLSLDEFAAAFAEQPEPEETEDDSGDDSDDGMPSEAEMAKAMAMLDSFNAQMDAGKSPEEAALALAGARTSADSAAADYADEQSYEAPRVVVLEEIDWNGGKKPVRYVVVYRDKALGKTGIALHGPPSL